MLRGARDMRGGRVIEHGCTISKAVAEKGPRTWQRKSDGAFGRSVTGDKRQRKAQRSHDESWMTA